MVGRVVMGGWSLVREVFREFGRDGCIPMAGSLAFFTLFSFPPIVAIVVELAALLVERSVAKAEILRFVAQVAGSGVAGQVEAVLEAGAASTGGGLLGGILSLVLFLFAATMVLAQAQQALNRVWGVLPGGKGFQTFLVKRAVSLLMIVGLVVVLLVSLSTSAVLSLVGARAEALLPQGWTTLLLSTTSAAVSYTLLSLVLVALFKVLPEAKVPWSDAISGAMLTGILLGAGKEVIGWVLGALPLGTAFGAARSLAVLLFWIFYSSAIVLWGAELTKVLARRRGHRVEPVEGAVRARRRPPVEEGSRPDDAPSGA